MNPRISGVLAGVLGLAALVAWAVVGPDRFGPREPAERQQLALLTSLPLIFGESFGLEGSGSPALSRLEQRYRVDPIGVADAASLKGRQLLLMAHPRAQPAEALVELDRWVREGGRVVLLADPRLDWPTERPLGDRLRPPPAFADTGLLKHWGLSLEAPPTAGEATAGKLSAKGACRIEDEGLVARCVLGRGHATVIADADFLNVSQSDSENLDLLVEELARLDSR
ncbi:MAG TPA: hypothetical protein VGD23_08055 [Sphingomicrobium sp.]